MTEFLDLNQKVEPPVKIVYQTVVQQHPWYVDLAKTLLVIVIASTIVWGVSKADISQTAVTTPEVTSFSVLGLVSDITDSSFSVNNINISEYATAASYTFDTSTLQKIETNEYVLLQFSDVKLGDKIIVQGTSENNLFSATRIIDFTSTPALVATTTTPLEATSTDMIATSTDEFASSTATSTDDTDTTIATTTEDATPTTTPEVIPEIPPVPDIPVIDATTTTS